MTDYIIEILTKVSFDKELFNKELHKSRRWLEKEEWNTVCLWVNEFHFDKVDSNFGELCDPFGKIKQLNP